RGALAAAVPGRPGIGLPVPARVQFRSPEVVRAERLLVEEGRRLRFGAGGTAALNERGDHGDGAAAHLVDRLAHVRPALGVEADRLDVWDPAEDASVLEVHEPPVAVH